VSVRVESADVDRFRVLLTRRFGLALSGLRPAEIAAVLAERVDASARSPAAYLDDLAAGASGPELDALAAAVTVPETYFFRNPEQFRALAEVVVPDRMRVRATTRRLSLLSMACATGEEAYSLAMAARNAIAEPGWAVDVLGVDLNPAALGVAARGRYPEWSLRAMPPLLRRRWLPPDGALVRVDDEVRRCVRFMAANLAADGDSPAGRWQLPGGYDVIFCRNVLMYLTPGHASSAVSRLVAALAPGGFLFLGHAETGYGRVAGLDLQHTHHAFYFRRPEASAVPVGSVPVGSVPVGAMPEPRAPVLADRAVLPILQPAGVALVTPPAGPPPPVRDRVLSLMRQERFDEALALHEESDATRDPDAGLLRGVLLAQCGRLDGADAECRRLLAGNGLDAGAHYLLAVCREAAGDRPAAEFHAHMAAYLDPSFAMPRLRLGLQARRRGDVHTAHHELGSALTLLAGEDHDRILLFGGGFTRAALIELCRRELRSCGNTA
jgi:chemotaxis protein methyltransferase CheR